MVGFRPIGGTYNLQWIKGKDSVKPDHVTESHVTILMCSVTVM